MLSRHPPVRAGTWNFHIIETFIKIGESGWAFSPVIARFGPIEGNSQVRILRPILFLLLPICITPNIYSQTTFLDPEFQVNDYSEGGQGGVDVAIDSEGNFLIVWSGAHPDGGKAIWAKWYLSNGEPVGAEFKVNLTSNSVGNASLAMFHDGNALVVWRETGPMQIRGRLISHLGGALGSEIDIPSSSDWYVGIPSVTADRRGEAVVAWDGLDEAVLARRFHSDGTAIDDDFRVNTCTMCHSTYEVAVDAGSNGNFVVTWISGNDQMARAYSPAGMPIGPDFLVDSSVTASNNGGTAVDFAGRFLALWSAGEVYARLFDINGIPTSEKILLNDEEDTSAYANISRNDFGNFVVAYSDWNGPWAIFTHSFVNVFQPLEHDLKVNESDENSGGKPKVAIDNSGNGVVAWETEPDTGLSGNVFARRFMVRFVLFRDSFESGDLEAWSEIVE